MAEEIVDALLAKTYHNCWKISTCGTKKLSTPSRINTEKTTPKIIAKLLKSGGKWQL